MQWKDVHIGFENDGVLVHGVNIWKTKWHCTGEAVELPHPAHPKQIHHYRIYETDAGKRFAASELSAGVWGFYVTND